MANAQIVQQNENAAHMYSPKSCGASDATTSGHGHGLPLQIVAGVEGVDLITRRPKALGRNIVGRIRLESGAEALGPALGMAALTPTAWIPFSRTSSAAKQ